MMRNSLITRSLERSTTIMSAESGFSLVEFLVSACVLVIISGAIFEIIGGIPRAAAYQADTQSVLCNARVALETAERLLRQAGNDPQNKGIEGLKIIGPSEIQVQSDLTGASGPSNPDKGDPDGDVDDVGENVVLRYDAAAKTLEMGASGGSLQSIANNIDSFAMQFYDADGSTTFIGSEVRRIDLTLTAVGAIKHPQTGRVFGLHLDQTVFLATRH
jgi:type II secretory pathway pseudopilin PulG